MLKYSYYREDGEKKLVLFLNLLLYSVIALSIGYALNRITNADGEPRLHWLIVGLLIGGACGLGNAAMASLDVSLGGFNLSMFGNPFKMDLILNLYDGAQATGLIIGLPIGLLTAYDMSKRFTIIDGWILMFKIVIVYVVVGGSIASLAEPRYTTEQWVDFLMFGLTQGGIYALIALGYTLVYGILFMINFAHGEIFMSGAFTAFFVAAALAEGEPSMLEANPILALTIIFLVAMGTSTIVAVTLERVAYRPLRRAPRLVALITAIGASFFLQYTFRGFYGSGVSAYPQVPVLAGMLTVGDALYFIAMASIVGVGVAIFQFIRPAIRRRLLDYSALEWWVPSATMLVVVGMAAYLLTLPLYDIFAENVNMQFPLSADVAAEEEITHTVELPLFIRKIQFTVIMASLMFMAALFYFVQYTKLGKAMRAVAEDKDVAALMGINVDRVITMTFALGAIMAGAAGVLYGLVFRQVHFFMGFIPGIKAFTAAVLGGIGSVPGAMIGGFFLGIFESLGPSLFLEGLGIASPNQLKDVIAFTMLVLVLIFRPTGIMGIDLDKKKA